MSHDRPMKVEQLIEALLELELDRPVYIGGYDTLDPVTAVNELDDRTVVIS